MRFKRNTPEDVLEGFRSLENGDDPWFLMEARNANGDRTQDILCHLSWLGVDEATGLSRLGVELTEAVISIPPIEFRNPVEPPAVPLKAQLCRAKQARDTRAEAPSGGGSKTKTVLAERNRQIREANRQGVSIDELVKTYGIARRQVRRVLAKKHRDRTRESQGGGNGEG